MTALLIPLVLVPLSIYHRMRASIVSAAALLRLPLIYAGIGFGIWRGVQVRVWRDAAHRYFVQGTRVTLALWGALISKMILSARRSAES